MQEYDRDCERTNSAMRKIDEAIEAFVRKDSEVISHF